MPDTQLFEALEVQTCSEPVFTDIRPVVLLREGLYSVYYNAAFKGGDSGVVEARLIYNDGLISTAYVGSKATYISGTVELPGHGSLKFQMRAIRGVAKAVLVVFSISSAGARPSEPPQLK